MFWRNGHVHVFDLNCMQVPRRRNANKQHPRGHAMPRFAVLVASLSFAQRTKEVRNGEMLDLTGGPKPETEFSPEVIRMFDAISRRTQS